MHSCIPKRCKKNLGGFHLYLLVFPFVYQFYSIIEALVSSSFANDEFRRISVSFQHHFKIYLLWLLHEKECSFYSYLFCCTEMTWMFIISTTIWVNGWDTSSVASRARSELTSSQCNWKGNRKGKGTDETPPLYLISYRFITFYFGINLTSITLDEQKHDSRLGQVSIKEAKEGEGRVDGHMDRVLSKFIYGELSSNHPIS